MKETNMAEPMFSQLKKSSEENLQYARLSQTLIGMVYMNILETGPLGKDISAYP